MVPLNQNKKREEVLKRVLYQGHKLRNAIVRSIAEYDSNESLLEINEKTTKNSFSSSAKENQPPTVPVLNLSELNETSATFTRNDYDYNQTILTKSTENTAGTRCKSNCTLDKMNTAQSTISKYVKYADCLKVIVHKVNLNQAGNRKVTSSRMDQKYKLPLSISHMYFVKYNIPKQIANVQTESKVDSGLNNDIRICSKKFFNDGIYFNQTFVHEIANLDQFDLNKLEIAFEISCRTLKCKSVNVIGRAVFNFATFLHGKYLCCTQELPIRDKAVVLGNLKVSLYLGSGKLYFEREFVDFLYVNNSDVKTISDEDILKEHLKDNDAGKKVLDASTPKVICSKSTENLDTENTATISELLYGLLFVSEAEYCKEAINSYISSQVFCEGNVLCSRVVYNSIKPVFNFYQKVPFLYDDYFLRLVKNNLMVLEFWKRTELEDLLIGCTSINLHPFYVAYRNRSIANQLLSKKLPVTVTDWWEPICSTRTGEVYGQVKVLIALGTEEQINNLELHRGLTNQTLTVTHLPILARDKEIVRGKEVNFRRPERLTDYKVRVKQVDRVDVATQSERMEDENAIRTRRMLEQLLSKLSTQSPRETRDDNVAVSRESTNLQIKKTSDLLDELKGALFTDPIGTSTPPVTVDDEKKFKAHVVIAEALHLPCRKKCRHKKSKKKRDYYDIVQGTYATFDASEKHEVVSTLSRKLSNPQWNFHSDVLLPIELLHNGEKRLIFKVWRQLGMKPNKEADEVVGFAACDLTALSSGLPSIQGWYNIVDFSNKCNGQIKIEVTPSEEVATVPKEVRIVSPLANTNVCSESTSTSEEPGKLLSRALKRKFIELEEITERLRSRLTDVTNEDSSHTSDDDIADQFEQDINTCVSNDEDSSQDFASSNHVTLPTLSSPSDIQFMNSPECDKFLVKEKQHIDTLLEKLTLLSNADSSLLNRFVSGCSAGDDTSIPSSSKHVAFDPELCSIPAGSTGADSESTYSSSNNSSLLTMLRKAPDGTSIDGSMHKQKL